MGSCSVLTGFLEGCFSNGEASAIDARLLIVELNTPGGEVGSVMDIINLFDNSKIPVSLFVSPLGAQAWSGGTHVLMASHVAVMASGTTIGSAQPVLSTGETINASKYVNALVGLMRNHARLHGRNETLAELFVTRNINLGSEEALTHHIIDFIADDIPQLLRVLRGESNFLDPSRSLMNTFSTFRTALH